jgi:hypothetical protein
VRWRDMDHPFTVTTASYYYSTGIALRQRMLVAAVEKRVLNDVSFAAASRDVSAARTKTAIYQSLLDAVQTRGRHYKTMYAFYGAETQARVKFQNYQVRACVLNK